MNKKNKGFTTIELITSFTLASIIMIILFNIILILKDNLSEVNAKTNMLVNKDNLSYNINKRFKEKELSSITMCEEGDKCYEFKYSDDTSDKLIYSNTDKTITFNNYTFDIIDGITVEEPTITEHYDTMSSTTFNGYFIIHIPIKIDNKDYSIKINKHFNTDSLVIDLTEYQYDNVNNKYTPVEYIESTGTQWIDTLIKSKSSLMFNFLFEGKAYNDNSLFGGRSGNYKNVFTITLYDDGSQYGTIVRFGNSDNILVGSLSLNNKYNVTMSKNGFYIDNEKIKDVIQYEFSETGYGLSVFAYRNFTNGSIIKYGVLKLYWFKIYDNNLLVRDYIPVIDSSERPCLFDKVEKKCYYNQGTGEFLYG